MSLGLTMMHGNKQSSTSSKEHSAKPETHSMQFEKHKSVERKDCLYKEPTLGSFFQLLCETMGANKCLHVMCSGYENYAVPSEVAKLEAKTVSEALQCEQADLLIFDLPLNWKDGAGKSQQKKRNKKTLPNMTTFLPTKISQDQVKS